MSLEGGREGEREGGWVGGREGGRESGREGGWDGGKATHGFLVVANDNSRHKKVNKMHIETT